MVLEVLKLKKGFFPLNLELFAVVFVMLLVSTYSQEEEIAAQELIDVEAFPIPTLASINASLSIRRLRKRFISQYEKNLAYFNIFIPLFFEFTCLFAIPDKIIGTIPALKFYVTVGDSNVGPTTPIRHIYQLTLSAIWGESKIATQAIDEYLKTK